LKMGMGEVKPGFYFQTSAPTVMRDLILVGGWVFDNVEVGEPSGAVRAFSADTGELMWAWDLGNPDIARFPPEGESYTRGTPNVWSTPAYDDALGLVYLPTGNATPDFFGGHRSKAAEEYTAS
ncbi:membrane-bound PQQ-dependent dehydrogenase, glucose/quinate/shikimate family, partial [Rhizobiaceae sp. 2RAB30]